MSSADKTYSFVRLRILVSDDESDARRARHGDRWRHLQGRRFDGRPFFDGRRRSDGRRRHGDGRLRVARQRDEKRVSLRRRRQRDWRSDGHDGRRTRCDGRLVDRRRWRRRRTDRHMIDRRLTDRRMIDSRLSEGRLMNGKLIDSRRSEGRLMNGRLIDSRMIDRRLSDSRLHSAARRRQRHRQAASHPRLRHAKVRLVPLNRRRCRRRRRRVPVGRAEQPPAGGHVLAPPRRVPAHARAHVHAGRHARGVHVRRSETRLSERRRHRDRIGVVRGRVRPGVGVSVERGGVDGQGVVGGGRRGRREDGRLDDVRLADRLSVGRPARGTPPRITTHAHIRTSRTECILRPTLSSPISYVCRFSRAQPQLPNDC